MASTVVMGASLLAGATGAAPAPKGAFARSSKEFTHRMAFGCWINDMRTEPLPFSGWPPPVLDDVTVDSIIRMLDLNAQFGYNKLDIYGLFTTWGWPVDIPSAVDPERAKRVKKIIQAAQKRNIEVVYGLGVYSWGFDEIIKHDPNVAGPNPHAMCASTDASFEWQKKVIDFVLEWEIDGFHLESADQGRCTCDKCMERWPDQFEYHHHITSLAADYIRSKSPEKHLCTTLISWMDWNLKLNDRNKELLVALSDKVDCIYDQGHHSCYLKESERQEFISRLHCDWGTSGGVWVYPPFRYHRLNWFLPYAQGTGRHIRSLFEDGGRGVMYYQGPVNNPGAEANIAFGGEIMSNPSQSVEDALSRVLEELYKPKTPEALDKLVKVFVKAEDAYFGNMDYDEDGVHLKTLKAFPGPGELHISFPVAGASGPPAYIFEPNLTLDGRAAYQQGLQECLKEVLDLEGTLEAEAKRKDLETALLNTLTIVRTAVDAERGVGKRSYE